MKISYLLRVYLFVSFNVFRYMVTEKVLRSDGKMRKKR